MAKILHASHPTASASHPLKSITLCGKMIRFGGFAFKGTDEVTCKLCIKIQRTLCPTCFGTGVKTKVKVGE